MNRPSQRSDEAPLTASRSAQVAASLAGDAGMFGAVVWLLCGDQRLAAQVAAQVPVARETAERLLDDAIDARGPQLPDIARCAATIAVLTVALAQLPEDANLWALRGFTRWVVGDTGRARSDAVQALELAPEHPFAQAVTMLA